MSPLPVQSGDKKTAPGPSGKKNINVNQQTASEVDKSENFTEIQIPRECDPFQLLLRENETLATEIQCKKGIIAELKRKLAEAEEEAEQAKRDNAELCLHSAKEAAAAIASAKNRIRILRRELEDRNKENLGLAAKVSLLEERLTEVQEKIARNKGNSDLSSSAMMSDLLTLRIERIEAEVDFLKDTQEVKFQEKQREELTKRVQSIESKLKEMPRLDNSTTGTSASSLSPKKFHQSPFPVHPSVCVSKNLWIKD